MRIDVICDGCQTRMKVADKFAGRTIECPKCKHAVNVPMQFEEAAPDEEAPLLEAAEPDEPNIEDWLDEASVIEPQAPAPPSQQRPIRYHENVRLMLRILEFLAYFALAGVILVGVHIGRNVDAFTGFLVGAGGTVALLPYIIIFRILEMIADIEVNTRITANALGDLVRMMREGQEE